MRLFTGIDLPELIQERLDVLISHLRSTAHLKWSPVYNLHITTKFIGEWPAPQLSALSAALKAVKASGPVEIRVRGLGWFPDQKNPHVFWAGIEANAALAELARSTGQALALLGVPSEERAFSAHLTLARIKQPVPLDPLRHAIARLESAEFGHFTAQSFFLYRSEPGPSGSIYTKVEEYPLPSA
jgi:RNA 2',3'-cyclic 3'-phosphodiesterase